jgi:hypothetical protein
MGKKILSTIIMVCFLAMVGSVSALDLTISSMTDVEANCPYDMETRTYSCNADNIYITGDTILPRDGETSRNIAIETTQDLVMFNSRLAADSGENAPGGTVTIISGEILLVGSIISASSQSWASGSNAGEISITANSLNVDTLSTISSNGGQSGWGKRGGTGGKINIIVDTADINGTIASYAGRGYASHAQGGTGGPVNIDARILSVDGLIISSCPMSLGNYNSGGNGGTVQITSDYLDVSGTISAKAGDSSWARMSRGGSGGQVIINSARIDMNGYVTVDRSCGSMGCGSAGTITTYYCTITPADEPVTKTHYSAEVGGSIVFVDGDGVLYTEDLCLWTPAESIVNADGCSVFQLCESNTYKNHGKYVSCVSHTAEAFLDAGLITEAEKDATVSVAGKSDVGKKK